MQYIFIDESGTTSGGYLVIGSLWGTADALEKLASACEPAIQRHFPNRRELKWTKVGKQKLEGYTEILSAFVYTPGIEFRCLVVNREILDFNHYSGGDEELGYYKFVYQLVSKNIEKDVLYRPGRHLYIVYHDTVSAEIRQQASLMKLKDILNTALVRYRFKERDLVRDIQPLDSKDSIYLQITDLLTGAVRHAFDTPEPKPSAKQSVIDHLSKNVRGSINQRTSYLAQKINIWVFKPKSHSTKNPPRA